MENILQSLVKIIIIGALCEKASVDANRQFLPPPPPPPLPYYPNEDYYIPGFAPALRHHLPTYYPLRHPPAPTSFANVNSFASPQLFHQNDDYVPPMAAPAQALPYKQPPQPRQPQQKVNVVFSGVQYKGSPQAQRGRPQQHSQKKTEAFASNIIVKDEPLYSDDYGKNYNDEDYTDSYSDDVVAPPKPCSATNPYRFFEAPKGPPGGDKSPPCNPYFQPNFGSGVYTLKVPITLLPSRFPPRVEQLIERIQNYFSTYAHQQTSKPENETVGSSSAPPAAEASTESAAQPSTAEENMPNNPLGETEQERTTATANVVEQIAERTTTATAETKGTQMFSTGAPEVQVQDGSQMEAQTIRTAAVVTEQVPAEGSIPQNRPMEETSPAGGENPHNLVPQELHSMHNSSGPPAEQNVAAFQGHMSNNS